MTEVFSIAGHKGGTGKTTLTANLAAGLVERGRTVLMIDADPQSSLTDAFKVKPNGAHLAEALTAGDRAAAFAGIIQELRPGLHIAPSDIDLADVERELGRVTLGGAFTLRRTLAGAPKVDYILIDCPPSLGLMTVNALIASDFVIVPILPEFVSLRALPAFWRLIEEVRVPEGNPDLEIAGIVPCMVDRRLVLHRQVIELLEADWPLLGAEIPRSVRAAEAPAGGMTLFDYEPNHKVTASFRRLAELVDGA